MKVKDWLMDLMMNNRVDIIDGEICILPIKDEDEDE